VRTKSQLRGAGTWPEGGEGARKADKHRTEGGSHRPISASSMWIVCHETLRAGPVQALRAVGQTLPACVLPNTEGGQTADGRWNPPTNFRHLVGDLLGMGNLRRSWHPVPGADPTGRRTAATHRKIARRTARPISEGGRATVGRWNGDGRKVEPTERFRAPHWRLLGMRNSAPMPRPQLSGAIGGRLWPPPHEGTAALEEMGS
jgi:hypothetical protein